VKTVIVLAMHGAPPRDFPPRELAEFFGLTGRLEHGALPSAERAALKRRHSEMEARMLAWPRTPDNDPFHAASLALAAQVQQAARCEVVLGFNEFCAPDLDEALDHAASLGPGKVIVTTAMMTPGGEHAEVDIPQAVQRARARHTGIEFVYAWPFDAAEIGRFLAEQAARFA
jgi:sirohydrochlorin cobaltochelatase